MAQSSSLTIQQMNDIIAASVQMTPYGTGAKMIISAVKYTTSGGYKVCWSSARERHRMDDRLSPPVTIPTGLVTDGYQRRPSRHPGGNTPIPRPSTISEGHLGTGRSRSRTRLLFRPRTSATVIYDGKQGLRRLSAEFSLRRSMPEHYLQERPGRRSSYERVISR